jgi:TRAP-type mannitol/chloroaromatic compound transport system permease small subunit
MDAFLRWIDAVNERVGITVKWLILILTAVMVYDVVMRYVFNAPTVWGFDISYMLGGTFFILGMGYTLLKDKHVRVDVISAKFSPRTKAFVELAGHVLLFFPAFGLLFWQLVPYVARSWMDQEKSLESFWRPPIYPFKTALLVGVALLLLQGVASFVRNLRILAGTGEAQ